VLLVLTHLGLVGLLLAVLECVPVDPRSIRRLFIDDQEVVFR
jgi:hypothetical protein